MLHLNSIADAYADIHLCSVWVSKHADFLPIRYRSINVCSRSHRGMVSEPVITLGLRLLHAVSR